MSEEEFLKDLISFGLIVRADYETIKQFKQSIADNPELNIIYQRLSLDKLIITSATPSGSNADDKL
jgi:hypothetical protein